MSLTEFCLCRCDSRRRLPVLACLFPPISFGSREPTECVATSNKTRGEVHKTAVGCCVGGSSCAWRTLEFDIPSCAASIVGFAPLKEPGSKQGETGPVGPHFLVNFTEQMHPLKILLGSHFRSMLCIVVGLPAFAEIQRGWLLCQSSPFFQTPFDLFVSK